MYISQVYRVQVLQYKPSSTFGVLQYVRSTVLNTVVALYSMLRIKVIPVLAVYGSLPVLVPATEVLPVTSTSVYIFLPPAKTRPRINSHEHDYNCTVSSQRRVLLPRYYRYKVLEYELSIKLVLVRKQTF
jgi:hypothetical protein